MTTPPVILRLLGRVSYSKALAIQESLATKYKTVQSSQVSTTVCTIARAV